MPGGFDRLQAELLQGVGQALIDQLDAFGVIPVGGFHLQGALEIVQDRQHVAHQVHGGELQEVRAFALGAAAGVLELGAGAQQPVLQFGLLGGQLVALGGQRRKLAFQIESNGVRPRAILSG